MKAKDDVAPSESEPDEDEILDELTVTPKPKPLVLLPAILLRPIREPPRPGYPTCSWCGVELTNLGRNPAAKNAPVLCARCFGAETYKGRKLAFSPNVTVKIAWGGE